MFSNFSLKGYVNTEGMARINESAAEVQAAVDEGKWQLATYLWGTTEGVVWAETNYVDFYNVLSKGGEYQRTLASQTNKMSG